MGESQVPGVFRLELWLCMGAKSVAEAEELCYTPKLYQGMNYLCV